MSLHIRVLRRSTKCFALSIKWQQLCVFRHAPELHSFSDQQLPLCSTSGLTRSVHACCCSRPATKHTAGSRGAARQTPPWLLVSLGLGNFPLDLGPTIVIVRNGVCDTPVRTGFVTPLLETESVTPLLERGL